MSGVTSATRPAIYLSELADNAACAGATHFVSDYALGAFELTATDRTAVSGGAKAGSFGGGGSSKKGEATLKLGGDIESCRTQDQRACRVPIRLTLRPITSGPRPAVSDQVAQAPGAGAVSSGGSLLIASARQKQAAKDGRGCLTDLDQAVRIDPQLNDGELRALCELRAGDCALGKRHYREILGTKDVQRKFPDQYLDMQAEIIVMQTCPGPMGTATEVLQAATRRAKDATEKQDATGAETAAGEIVSLVARLHPTLAQLYGQGYPLDPDVEFPLSRALERVAQAGRCSEAKAIMEKYLRVTKPALTPVQAHAAADGDLLLDRVECRKNRH